MPKRYEEYKKQLDMNHSNYFLHRPVRLADKPWLEVLFADLL
jgi:hypothetical protein